MRLNPTKRTATIGPAFPFASQACQYPSSRPEGVHYFGGAMPWGVVDCLLYYGPDRKLWGILNHYGHELCLRCPAGQAIEKAGNINIYVSPDHKRAGVGTALLREAMKRWPVNLDQQRYTEEGAVFINKFKP